MFVLVIALLAIVALAAYAMTRPTAAPVRVQTPVRRSVDLFAPLEGHQNRTDAFPRGTWVR